MRNICARKDHEGHYTTDACQLRFGETFDSDKVQFGALIEFLLSSVASGDLIVKMAPGIVPLFSLGIIRTPVG